MIETKVRDARNTGGTRSRLNPVVDSLVRVSSQLGIGVSFQEELLQKVQNEATLFEHENTRYYTYVVRVVRKYVRTYF